MSQQGGRPTGHDDDWWGQLYDDSTDDTGPTTAPDSLDDRFASAAGTVAGRPGQDPDEEPQPPQPPPADDHPPWWAADPPAVPAPRTARPTRPTRPPDAEEGLPGSDSPRSPLFVGGAEDPGPPDPPVPPQPPHEQQPGPVHPVDPVDPAPPPLPSALPPLPPSPPPGFRQGPHDRTTSGTGPADLTEPPATPLPAPRSAPGAPPPPPRITPHLPPLPPPFLPSQPPRPLPPQAQDGTGETGEASPFARDYVGSGPPTYDAEPTALPPADPDGLDGLVADTVLDGARYGTCTLRAVSVRGDSARYRGDPRRDALLVARFGAAEQALVLVAMATGARATAGAHRAAAEVCQWIGRAVGRSHARLAEDLRAARRGDLKSGLHRLTDRSLGRLRAGAAEQGLAPDEYAATLRCLLLPADPECRTRVFFGVGPGGLLRLRNGTWQDMEPSAGAVTGESVVGFGSPPIGRSGETAGAPSSEVPGDDRLTMGLGITTSPGPYDERLAEPPREPFRFRASVAHPGDVLLMCTAGLAEPLLSEPDLGELLARRWAGRTPPGLAEFLADSRVRVKGYADDRTAAAVWEA
ncbi:protein phosphatase 2C domain-containing protein [Streptomyces sp. NPDC017454]|uniref:protein phosphatase 2C domain-containing protein n=1 Tax=Streptomyces sp. NPDC017454 TaxID=3364997 RepID=UPI0037B3F6E6